MYMTTSYSQHSNKIEIINETNMRIREYQKI